MPPPKATMNATPQMPTRSMPLERARITPKRADEITARNWSSSSTVRRHPRNGAAPRGTCTGSRASTSAVSPCVILCIAGPYHLRRVVRRERVGDASTSPGPAPAQGEGGGRSVPGPAPAGDHWICTLPQFVNAPSEPSSARP